MKFQMSNKKTSDHHATPQRVFDHALKHWKIDLKKMFDPCPLHAKFNGLKIKFKKQNYINPPYSKLEEFVRKCYNEWFEGKDCYLLYPLSKTDKPYFVLLEDFRIKFFPFRIKFVGAKNPSPQTHCLVIMK